MTRTFPPRTRSQLPQDDDVVVTRVSATREYIAAIVPHAPHCTYGRYDAAVEGARTLARERGVDAWISEDLTHFIRLATFRPSCGAEVTSRPLSA